MNKDNLKVELKTARGGNFAPRRYAHSVLSSSFSLRLELQTKKGAQVINPSPALQFCRTQYVDTQRASVTAIARSVVGYGPTNAPRASDDLIGETTFLIFGDDLDAGAAAIRVADCERSTIR